MAEYIVDTTDGILNARTVGELIRCKDCLYMETHCAFGNVAAFCYLDEDGNVCNGMDSYCSRAKRRPTGDGRNRYGL